MNESRFPRPVKPLAATREDGIIKPTVLVGFVDRGCDRAAMRLISGVLIPSG